MRHSNSSYLSNTVIFHFHDYGPKEYPFHRKNLHGTPPSALGPIRRKRGEAELAELVSDRNSWRRSAPHKRISKEIRSSSDFKLPKVSVFGWGKQADVTYTLSKCVFEWFDRGGFVFLEEIHIINNSWIGCIVEVQLGYMTGTCKWYPPWSLAW